MPEQLLLFPTCSVLGCTSKASGFIASLPFCDHHYALVIAQGQKQAK